MKTKNIMSYLFVLISAAVIFTLASFVPAVLTRYNDAMVMDRVDTQPAAELAGGFRYRLTPNERVYILSMALQNRILPQSDFAAAMRGRTSSDADPSISFAYTENRRGPSSGELTVDDALMACSATLSEFQASGVLPAFRFQPETDAYDIQLYTAVDILDPQKNISVWQIAYAQDKPLADYRGALLEAWLDAETGALYGFSLRAETQPAVFRPDAIMDAWRLQVQLGDAEVLADDNPLAETTTHYEKFTIDGMDNEKIVVTVGYYEGIHEIFLRIT